MRTLLAVVLVAALAPAAPVPKALKPKTDDKTALVGVWRPAPGTRDESFRFTEDGRMQAWSGQARDGGTSFPFSWSIDPTTDPKQMTWGDAASKQLSFECVYELDGDRLRIGYGQPAKRPTGVTAGQAMFVCDLVRDSSAK